MISVVTQVKICAKCRGAKSLDAFHQDMTRLDGKQPYCKTCRRPGAGASEALRKYRQLHYSANRGTVLAQVKARAVREPDKIQECRRKYYQANAAKVKADVARWQKAHPHIVAWRRVLGNTLSKLGLRKEGHTVDLLGYSAEDLRKHLEKIWTPTMSWDNYGEWHIDHIRPVNSFNPATPPSVVNALSNLRPLWATNRVVDGVQYEGNLNRDKRWDGV